MSCAPTLTGTDETYDDTDTWEDACLCSSICAWWLCYVRQEEWPPKDKRRREKQLYFPFPLVVLDVLFIVLAFSFINFYLTIDLESALFWIVEELGRGRGCLNNVSREWWYALVIFWSSLTRHILVVCLTNTKYFVFLRCRKLSINNCWHFLCLDWVTVKLLLKT